MNKIHTIFLLAAISAVAIYFTIPDSEIHNNQALPQLSDVSARLADNIFDQSGELADISKLKTFRATGVDGTLAVDEFNHLIVDRQLRYWIDFHLAALGEIPLEEIKRLMLAEIAKLPEPGQGQARALLDKYLNYKSELAEFDASGSDFMSGDLDGMKARFEWQKRLRRQWMEPDTVEVFWQMDEAIDGLALEKLIIRNSDLPEAEKQLALRQAEQAMPDEWQEFRGQAQQASQLHLQVESMRNSDEYSEQDVRELRLQTVGEEATTRLEQVDQQQNQWQQRIRALIAEEQRLAAIDGLSSEEKTQLLDEYKQQNFANKELLRLDAAKQLLTQE